MAESSDIKSKVTELRELVKSVIPEHKGSKSKSKVPNGGQPTSFFINRDFSQFLPVNNHDEVYPGIILGDSHLAREIHQLRQLRVTHVLNAAQGEKFAQIDTNESTYSHAHIKFLGIKAMDVANFQLKTFFQEAADFIHNALNNGGKVYVHCFQGISRSATLVIAYLMLYKHISLRDAIVIIRRVRAIYPNDGFLKQLLLYEEELNEKQSEDKIDTSETK